MANTQTVEAKFLLVRVAMPLDALLAVTLLIGIGILVALGLSGRRPQKE
jgi:hypothetical protein